MSESQEEGCPMPKYSVCTHVKRQRAIIKDLKNLIRELRAEMEATNE